MAKKFIGTVSSNKSDKTIVIKVSTQKTHPIYKKQYSITKKFMAHDEDNVAKIGDLVEIVETRPISANKHFKLVTVIEKAAISEDQTVDKITATAEKTEETV